MEINITDKQITDETGIPYATLQQWKKKPFTNWRRIVYKVLKTHIPTLEAIKEMRENNDDK